MSLYVDRTLERETSSSDLAVRTQGKAPADESVWALFRHFVAVYPARSLSVIILLSVAGLAEGFSVFALLPLINLSVAGDAASAGGVGAWLTQAVASVGLKPTIGTFLIVIVIGIGLKAVVTLIAMREVGYAVGRLMTELRQRLIVALMNARWSYFTERPLGIFANAMGAETIRAGATYQQSARLAAAAVQAVVYGVATMVISWRIALFAVFAGLVGVVVFRRAVAMAQESGLRQTDLMKSIAVRTTDMLQGIKAIKAMGAQQSALPLLDHEIRDLDDAQRKQVWSGEFLRVAQEPMLVVFLAIAMYGAIEFSGETLPTMMVIAVLFYRLFNRFQVMLEIYQVVCTGASAYWSVHHLCSDAEQQRERSSDRKVRAQTAPSIEFKDVSFAYGQKTVLDGVSLRIEPGEFIALCGASGGGKTTLLDTISGLLTPSRGGVIVDGNDLREIDLTSWRHHIGYVPQELLLLHDTVYQNICLGDPAISREAAEAALRAAEIWDHIAALPEGMDSLVGERGSRFSGGQRQRISLARALARKPIVLLLDEITAALDRDTEREICATLRRLAGQMTIVTVSHQPEILRVADRVFEFANGTATQVSQ
ncbi:MAG: ABC transporter ATP-binding protein [Pseudolabrys sp.]|nr:ABC transporter ATP-binding protein [Pseudolabrys sp.]